MGFLDLNASSLAIIPLPNRLSQSSAQYWSLFIMPGADKSSNYQYTAKRKNYSGRKICPNVTDYLAIVRGAFET